VTFVVRTLLAILLWALAANGQQIRFTLLQREVVEERLKTGPGKNDERHDRLEQMFREAQCGMNLTNQPVRGSKIPNVVCQLPGQTCSIIVVGAHFDNQGAGSGLVDNWSGASLLPSVFQSLRDVPRTHTFVFVGFTDEEKGLVGSKFYVKQLGGDELKAVNAMVNVDTVGLSSAKLWLSRADKELANAFYAVANSLDLPREAVNVEQVGSTDSESFRLKKIRSVTIHSLTQETLPILHTAQDQLSQIDLNHYYDTYRLLVAYLAFLDGKLN